MHRCRHLLVALPRTHADAGLLRYAAMLANLGAAVEVRFVHILPTQAGAYDRDHLLAAIEADVAEAFAQVPEVVKTYCNVLKGPLTDRLLEFAAEQEVDLILVGHRPVPSGRRSLARRLAMNAPCSVWMAPDGCDPAFRRILVPIDFSRHAADALEVAASLARLSGDEECLALHVYFNPAVASFEGYEQVMRGEERESFEQFVGGIDRQGIRVEPIFQESSSVPHAIARTVKDRGVDLVVMGTRGRSGSSAILLGSETEQTLVETRVPLLAVKHFGARLGVLRTLLNREFIQKNSPRFG